MTWRQPTLPQGYPCSTIGALKLNLPVRYGKGCYIHAIITRLVFIEKIIENLPSLTTDTRYKISSHYYFIVEIFFSLQKNILSKLHSEIFRIISIY